MGNPWGPFSDSLFPVLGRGFGFGPLSCLSCYICSCRRLPLVMVMRVMLMLRVVVVKVTCQKLHTTGPPLQTKEEEQVLPYWSLLFY